MLGNVWEWCLTAYETSLDVVEGYDARVLRGVSWKTSSPHIFRFAYRTACIPERRYDDYGFRIVRS